MVGKRLGKEFDDLYIGLADTTTAPMYPGMRQLVVDIASASDAKLAALSNAAVAYVQRVIKVHELAPLFAVLHGADDVPAPKPSGAGLIVTCKELGELIHTLWFGSLHPRSRLGEQIRDDPLPNEHEISRLV